MNQKTTVPPSIRVFVSSTFQDMKKEQDLLMRKIFPLIKRKCDNLSISFFVVDLGWGITEEEFEDGRQLVPRLNEIEHCNYFIGILGDRYGWTPQTIEPKALELYPWLKEHSSISVTEMEIIQGIFNPKEPSNTSLFYFRDPKYSDTLPTDEQVNYKEQLEEEGDNRREKLESLKQRIRDSKVLLRENYQTPEEVADYILMDLSRIIDEVFNENYNIIQTKQEVYEHDFARCYIKQSLYMNYLNDYINREDSPVVVFGPEGAGKSALLSQWASNYRIPGHVLIPIYCEAVGHYKSWVEVCLSILKHYDDRVGNLDFPFEDNDLYTELGVHGDRVLSENGVEHFQRNFRVWMENLPKDRTYIFVIDGLDNLWDCESVRQLSFLPHNLPSHVKLIVSTRDTQMLKTLKLRNWNILTLSGFEKSSDVYNFIGDYLNLYSMRLPIHRIQQFMEHPLSNHPLYTKTVLDFLLLHVNIESMDESIEELLGIMEFKDLYKTFYLTTIRDLSTEETTDFKQVLGLLATSREGLSEGDGMLLLNLTPIAWAKLRMKLEGFIKIRDGCYHLISTDLKTFVNEELLSDQEKMEFHKLLSRFYRMKVRMIHRREVNRIDCLWKSHLLLREVYYHLEMVNDWEVLHEEVKKQASIHAFMMFDTETFHDVWHGIIKYTRYRPNTTYKELIDVCTNDTWEINDSKSIETFIWQRSLTSLIKMIEELGSDACIKYTKNFNSGPMSYGDQVFDNELKNENFEILGQEYLLTKLGDRAGLHHGKLIEKMNQATIETLAGRSIEAIILLEKAVMDAREMKEEVLEGKMLGQLAGLYLLNQQLEIAWSHFERSEYLLRKNDEDQLLAQLLSDQCKALLMYGDKDGSIHFEKAKDKALEALHLAEVYQLKEIIFNAQTTLDRIEASWTTEVIEPKYELKPVEDIPFEDGVDLNVQLRKPSLMKRFLTKLKSFFK